jgi:hypothetical protein
MFEVDLKAPRCRFKTKSSLDRDFFIYLKNKQISLCKKYSQKQIKEVINTFNEYLEEGVLTNRDGVEIPIINKQLFVAACNAPVHKDVLDIKLSKEYKKPIINNNFETNGKICKLFFIPIKGRQEIRNIKVWAFKGRRLFVRNISKAFRKNWENYHLILDSLKVDYLYRYNKLLEKADNEAKVLLETYNEFEL